MLKLTRLMIVIAVAFFAASPVMACCLTGDHAPAIAEKTAGAAHCDNMLQDIEQAPVDTPNPLDCPGCGECDTAAVQAQPVIGGALLASNPSETPVAVLTVQFSGFDHPSLVFKTGPPGPSPLILQTPITLKQRLLI